MYDGQVYQIISDVSIIWREAGMFSNGCLYLLIKNVADLLASNWVKGFEMVNVWINGEWAVQIATEIHVSVSCLSETLTRG